MTNIIMILGVLVTIFIMLFVVILTLKNKYMILYLTMFVFAITTYEWLTDQTLRISLQIIQLNTLDIFTVYLVGMALLLNFKKEQQYQYPKSISYILYLAVAIFLFSMFRGLFHNSLALIVEDLRRLMENFFIPVLCFMYLPIELEDVKVRKILTNFVVCIVVFCAVCWVLDIVLGIKLMRAQSDAGSTMRVLRPEQALIVGMIAIYKVYKDLIREKRRHISIGSFVLITVVILLQHRSAWIALATGLIFVIIKCNQISIRNINQKSISTSLILQFIFLFACAPILWFVFKDSHLLTQLQAGLTGLTADEGNTLGYREQLWSAHLAGLNSIQWFIGKPFGSGYLIQLTGYAREITPHSAYVQTIIRTGIIGVVTVVILVLAIIRECSKRLSVWGTAICLMLLVFWYPYSYSFYTAIGLAFVIKSLRYNRGENVNE